MTESQINIIISAISALILFASIHGVFIRWHNLHLPYTPLKDAEKEKLRQAYIKRSSKLWHRLSLALRIFIWLIVWFVSNGSYWITVPVIVITAVSYPVIINLINRWKWYYVGKTALTDRIIRMVFYKVNFDK